jgi:hypothetical protein
MRTAEFWLGLLDRAIKSFAQALLVLWISDETFNILEVDFKQSLGVALGALVISVLTSIASGAIGDKESTSMIPNGR